MGNRHSAEAAAPTTTTFSVASAAANAAAVAQTSKPPRSSAMEAQRQEVIKESMRACLLLSQKSNCPPQSNLFFMPIYGLELDSAVARICKTVGYQLNSICETVRKDYDSSVRLYHEAAAEMWRDPASAVLALMLRQQQHQLMYMSRAPQYARGRHTSRVHVYTQSPVEDLYINLPMMLDNQCDANTIAQLRISMNTQWFELGDRMSTRCSVWIYLRISDNCWDELLGLLRQQNVPPEEVERMCVHRARMDYFFSKHQFVYDNHTLRIDVEYAQLDNEIVCMNVAKLVAEFVMDQYWADMWHPDADPAALSAHLKTLAYRQQRIKNAVATSWLEGSGVSGASMSYALRSQTISAAASRRMMAGSVHQLTESGSRIVTGVSAQAQQRQRRLSTTSSHGSSDSPRNSVSLSPSPSVSSVSGLRAINPMGAPANLTTSASSSLIASTPTTNVYDLPYGQNPHPRLSSGSKIGQLQDMRRASQPNFAVN
jgi:hypothetical protein